MVSNSNVQQWENPYNANNDEMVGNRSNAHSRYLWGSHPVWTPWAPDVVRAPTRTPPGFDIGREVEDENVSQHYIYK